MATPSLAMIPSAIADSKVYSVLPNNGDGDFTFNRDSSATRIGQNGLIQTVGFFGSDVLNGYNFTSGYTAYPSGSIDSATSFTSLSGGGGVRPNSDVLSSGKTYICSLAGTVPTGNIKLLQWDGAGNYSPSFSGTFDVTFEFIQTGSYNNFWLRNDAAATTTITKFTIQEITGDQPRLNYDISNGVVQSCPSLLLEPASTNSLVYSEDFSNAAWIKTSATVESGFVSPDGTLNADLLQLTLAGGNIYDGVGGSGDYSFSVFAKYKDAQYIRLRSTGSYAYFDIQNGVLGSTINVINTKIENYGNGWYRCSVIGNNTNALAQIYVSDTDGSNTGTGGVYLYGAQFEAGSYPTSIIPTTGAIQTRAAETCFGAGTSSTFNSTEGTLYAEFKSNNADLIGISIYGINANDRVCFYGQTGNSIVFRIRVGGVYVYTYSKISLDLTTTQKVALTYANNNVKAFINGVLVNSSTSVAATFPSGTLIQGAFDNAGAQDFYGKCKDLRVFNEALTDLQLQKLTTL